MPRPKQYADDSLHKYDFLIRERDEQDKRLCALLDSLKAQGGLSAFVRDALHAHMINAIAQSSTEQP